MDHHSPAKFTRPTGGPGIFGAIKKVFTPSPSSAPKVAPVKNTALRDILSKITADGGTPQKIVVKELPTKVGTPTNVGAVSLDVLKNQSVKTEKEVFRSKDRAASSQDMNKLKDLIKTSQPKVEASAPTPISAPIPTPTPIPKNPQPEVGQPKADKVREVPEDVLRKILE